MQVDIARLRENRRQLRDNKSSRYFILWCFDCQVKELAKRSPDGRPPDELYRCVKDSDWIKPTQQIQYCRKHKGKSIALNRFNNCWLCMKLECQRKRRNKNKVVF